MREGDELLIELPGGHTATVVIALPEDVDCLPELDIALSFKAIANCWSKGMEPGVPLGLQPWSVECCQICIPIERTVVESDDNACNVEGSEGNQADRRTKVAVDRVLSFDVDSFDAVSGVSQLASDAEHLALREIARRKRRNQPLVIAVCRFIGDRGYEEQLGGIFKESAEIDAVLKWRDRVCAGKKFVGLHFLEVRRV